MSKEILNYSTKVRVPLKRLGTPEEIAQTILWLLFEESSFINSHAMMIDDGMFAGR
tara:strand:+ start:102 stop:269 length:168 start_codon:yes stop_codon:yes gene_type:complete